MHEEEATADIKFQKEEEQLCDNPFPWMSQATKAIANPILRFHNEIIDFVEFVAPTPEEYEAKEALFSRLKEAIQSNLQADSHILAPFFKNKFEMRNGPLQIFVISKADEQSIKNCMHMVAEKVGLQVYNLSSQNRNEQIRFITEHQESHCSIWISFVSESWNAILTEFDDTIGRVPELKYLYLINYCIIKQRGLHTNIRSLLIFGICNFFMFERRRQRVRTLTENVIKFLEFFGLGSTHERKIIYYEGKSFNSYMSSDQRSFSFEIGNKIDIASGCRIRDYFKIIQNRYRVIGNCYYPPGTSSLVHLINPCLGEFFY